MINNERETHWRECSRSKGVNLRRRRVDFIDFPGVLLAITTPFFFVLKKSEKTENSVSVLQSSVMLANPTFWEFPKQKTDLFPFFREKKTLLVGNFNFTSPFENTYHLPCKFQLSPFPLVTWRCLRDRCRYLITQYIVFSIGRLAKLLHYLRFSIANALCSEKKVNLSTFD